VCGLTTRPPAPDHPGQPLASLVRTYKAEDKERSQALNPDSSHSSALDQDQASDIVAAFLAGIEVKQLASMYGIIRSTALDSLRRFGVHGRRTKLNASDVDRVVELCAQGWTIAAIAPVMGVGATTVRRVRIRFRDQRQVGGGLRWQGQGWLGSASSWSRRRGGTAAL
jgi:Helix-turn-helix domain of resolvase